MQFLTVVDNYAVFITEIAGKEIRVESTCRIGYKDAYYDVLMFIHEDGGVRTSISFFPGTNDGDMFFYRTCTEENGKVSGVVVSEDLFPFEQIILHANFYFAC